MPVVAASCNPLHKPSLVVTSSLQFTFTQQCNEPRRSPRQLKFISYRVVHKMCIFDWTELYNFGIVLIRNKITCYHSKIAHMAFTVCSLYLV